MSTQAWVKYEDLKDNGGRFIVSPLNKGMGNTVGNAMRRVLLSSLEGTAITSVKVDGVTHEFSTVPNVVEDVLDIICNLKGIVFKVQDNEPKKVTLEAKGKGTVSAKDIKTDGTVTVINGNHHIATLSDGAKLKIEITVETGVGFKPTQITREEDAGIDEINLDASFSPIKRVNHTVENVRVGEELDHEQLILDVWTDGSIEAEKTVVKAADILQAKFALFNSINEEPVEAAKEVEEKVEVDNSVLEMPIDDLELSARSSNCLKRAGLETVGELVEKDMSELIQIKNFGKKSADEINGKLAQYNLELKG